MFDFDDHGATAELIVIVAVCCVMAAAIILFIEYRRAAKDRHRMRTGFARFRTSEWLRALRTKRAKRLTHDPRPDDREDRPPR